MNELNYIREKLDDCELLCQLAEEAAELSKAALKLRRVYDGTNPTPVDPYEAYDNLMEEVADVKLVLFVLKIGDNAVDYSPRMKAKLSRWAGRLKGSEVGRGCTD